MRLLYITSGFPYPLTSGFLRHYFFIRELAKQHTITLASLVNGAFQREQEEALAPFTERVLPFSIPEKETARSPLKKALRHLRRLKGFTPAVRTMRRSVEELVRRESFDAVLFSGRETFPVLREMHHLPVVTDICDAVTLRVRGRLRQAPLRIRPWLLYEYRQMQRIERELMDRSAHLLFASARDERELVARSPKPSTVIPNGVDLEFWRRTTPQRGRNAIIFTGAMDYGPNVDAALHLVNDVLPLVREQRPGAELLIVGRNPVESLRAAGQRPGVQVTGFVEDVRPWMEKASVFAAPLRFGAGIQNKLLEAMAMELPIVTSTLAAEGISTENDKRLAIDITDDPEGFARSLCDKLAEADSDPAPQHELREYVGEHFVWEASGRRLGEILESVASPS